MLVPVEWLREYCDFEIEPEELARRLTMAGLEVEDIAEQGGQKVFSTYVTPNRPDLLSIVGVAREVSAILGTSFRPPKPSFTEGDTKAADLVAVDILSPVNCPRYSARVVLDTKVVESPAWMQERLIAAGMRPINSVVDATNYVLLELGQPLHAFDCDLVRDRRIIVRQAEAGEKMITLDGEERVLNPDTLVIADPKHAVAIAGVMGGGDTEVSWRTKHILLESAHFNRLSIRRTARSLQMNTEASYRFERGVDPGGTIEALNRVAELIVRMGGGSIARGVVDAYPVKIEPATARIRPKRTARVLGFEVPAADIQDYLTRLGMEVAPLDGDGFKVTVPTFRPDCRREDDLIEEVARIRGYDAIPEKLPEGETLQGRDSEEAAFAARISDVLVSAGLQEVVTGSMTRPVAGEGQVPIRNPISDDLSRLRKQLVLDLLSVLSYNWSRGVRDIGIFQIGRVFEPRDGGVLAEKLSVAAALTGSMWGPAWNVDRSSLESDFFLCKGVVQNLLARLNITDAAFKPAENPVFQSGGSAVIESGGVRIGIIGQIGAECAREADVPENTYAFEMDVEELAARSCALAAYAPISRFPAVTRDLAVVVADDVPYRSVEELLVKGAGELLENLNLFDLYSGPPLPSGRKSLAFTIVFRSHERTLRDEEADERLGEMRSLLASELGASFRDT